MKIALESQPNFRDLGGIQTNDGRKIKPGLLYRSGDLSRLDERELTMLGNLGIRAVIDFRAQREISRHPDILPKTVREVFFIHIHDTARDHAEKLFGERNAEALRSVLTDDYVRMVRYHRHDFARFLQILLTTQHLPLVYHCAAGKDRTGLATVFLLSALGVPADRITDDYMDTNRHVSALNDKIITKINGEGLDGEMLRPLFEVRIEYLNAAMTEIGTHYGGLDLYVRQQLQADISGLREKFLED
ncbi:MAG: tyrosine-protein phosphatase [Bacteroidales bacterium]|nr:tyrosine-protein phosphatase [Bacteroidales bacterium]HNW72989.1 tyrosine-protein phosphatase [Bacteroidales bacterium]HPS50969.1 tyrosine-protein phosphatase [Bacteroidales bacterium]